MSREFWTIACAFHLVAGAALLWLGRRIARLLLARPGGRASWASLAFDLPLCAAGIVAAAWISAHLLPDPLFAFTRFLAQAVFGEGLLLVVTLTFASAAAKRRTATICLGALTLLLLALYWEGYHHGPSDLRVRHHILDADPGTPQLTRPVRLLHISDLQVWQVGALERRVVHEAAALKPDLIVLTGDYVQERLTPTRASALRELRELLQSGPLRARLGVYATWGNVDGRNRHLFDGLGVRCLEDEVVRVRLPGGETLALVGLSYQTSVSPRSGRLEALMSQAGSADRCVVAGHAPDFALALAPEVRADLILAGHTHGGQIRLPWLPPLVRLSSVPPWLAAGGLHNVSGTPVHVSRGVGMERGSAPQMRLFCPPEICVIELR